MCTMLEKQDDNLIDSLIERVSGSSENVSGWSNLGVQDPAIDWQNERVIRQAEVNEVRVIEWAKSLAIFRSFAMGEWFNWKQTNKNWPGRATIYCDYSTTIYNILKRNEVYMVQVLPIVFSRVRVLHLDVALRDEFVSALVAHGNESTGHMHYRAPWALFYVFLSFFYSFLLSYSYFCSKVLGVSGSRMSLTSEKSGAPTPEEVSFLHRGKANKINIYNHSPRSENRCPSHADGNHQRNGADSRRFKVVSCCWANFAQCT